MNVRLKLKETAVRASQRHFEEAKRLRAKAEGMRKGIADLERKLQALEAKALQPRIEVAPKITVREARKREWFESFHWFRTSGGRLVVAGRDAKQNELLVARHLEPNDFFFHADIAGGAATILKDGVGANEQERRETAQWAACHSKAWKLGYTSIDVYAVGAGQVDKASPSGEYLAKGSFMIHGKKEWFRGTPLALALVKGAAGGLLVLPGWHAERPAGAVEVVPGAREKRALGEVIKARLGLESPEATLAALPGPAELR